MKTFGIKLIFSVVLTFFLIGCKKESVKTIGIKGEWIWVESVGGFGGWTLTPESENVTKKIERKELY